MLSNTYNRYLWLLNTLLVNKRMTFEEISNKWEESCLFDGKPLSIRTFHVHRNAVEEMFQVSIECDASDGYKYYVSDSDFLRSDNSRQWLLNSFNVDCMIHGGKAVKDRILFEDIPAGSEYLPMIVEAMRVNQVLLVEYLPFYEHTPTIYHVSPYCMKVHHQRWYILGFFEELGALRHFSLDRTLSIRMSDKLFEYPKDFSPVDFYKDVIGIWVNSEVKPEHIVIRVYGQQIKYFRTLPLHHSQEEVLNENLCPDTGGKSFVDFSYYMCVTDELVKELLAKGHNIEVLRPEALRLKILNETLSILKLYK